MAEPGKLKLKRTKSTCSSVSTRSSVARFAELKARAKAAQYRFNAEKDKADVEKQALDAQLKLREREFSIAAKEAEIEAFEFENALQDTGESESGSEKSGVRLSWDDELGRRPSSNWNSDRKQRREWTSEDRVQNFLKADSGYVPPSTSIPTSVAAQTGRMSTVPLTSKPSSMRVTTTSSSAVPFIGPPDASVPITQDSIMDDFGFSALDKPPVVTAQATNPTTVNQSTSAHINTMDEFAFLNQYDSMINARPRASITKVTPSQKSENEYAPRSHVHTRRGTTVTPPTPRIHGHSSVLTNGRDDGRGEMHFDHGQRDMHADQSRRKRSEDDQREHRHLRGNEDFLRGLFREQARVNTNQQSELSMTAGFLETIVQDCARTNIQVAETLARSQLPQIECEKFSGDPCSYTNWKRTVRAQLSMAMTYSERLLRLSKLVEKQPAEIVKQYSERFPNEPQAAYQKAWEILDYRYGRASVIANALLAKLNDQKKFTESDYDALQRFADLCTSVNLQIETMPGLKVLNFPMYLRPITGKLPQSFERKWTDHAYKWLRRAREDNPLTDKEYPTFAEFAKFVETLADKLCDPNLRTVTRNDDHHNKSTKFGQNPNLKDWKNNNKPSGSGYSGDKGPGVGSLPGGGPGTGNLEKRPGAGAGSDKTDKDSGSGKKKQKFCPAHPGLPAEYTHGLSKCRKFKSLDSAEQVELLKAYPENCRSCLETGHKSDCKAEIKCERDKCSKRHHSFLHEACEKLRSFDRNPHSYSGTLSYGGKQRNYAICPAQQAYSPRADGEGLVALNLMHDSGSNVSLGLTNVCESNLNARKVSEEPVTLNVEVLGGEKIAVEAHRYKIPLHDRNGNLITSVIVHGIERIGSDLPDVDICQALNIFGLEPKSDEDLFYPSGPVHVLLGMDNAHVAPSIISRIDGMVLAESSLGKLVYGSHPSFGNSTENASYKVTIRPSDLRMDLVPALFATDVLGISCTPKCGGCSCKQCPADGAPYTLQERYEYEQIKKSMTLEDRIITSSYPYVRDPAELLDNYEMAFRRLKHTERSLAKDPVRAKTYQNQFDDMLNRGVMRKLEEEEEAEWTGPVQYLPHNDVDKPGSQSTPTRIVLDPSSQYKGKAVNNYWGRGPCLMNDPIGILIRFREHPTALAGDISKMYWCVRTRPREWHLHRILWRNMQTDRKPDKYIIVRNSFGSGPAGTVAIAALNFLAERMQDKYPEAALVILRQAFIDDIVDSTPTVVEAERLTSEVDRILAEGSFKIKKWTIVSPSSSSSSESTPPGVAHLAQSDSVLGIAWDTTDDELHFKPRLNFSKKRKKIRQGPDLTPGQVQDRAIVPALTKRSIVSQVNSLYDPLGLLSPFLVELKFGVAKLWRHKDGLDWDEPVPEDLDQYWRRLFEIFFEVANLRFPRLLRPSTAVGHASLLAFSDSSMMSYCAAIYIRWELDDGMVFARLAMAKTRMWPIEPDDYLSVARGELMGILLAKRLVATMVKESRFDFGEIAYVSDSEIALAQVNMNSHEFGVWTGSRVAEIRTKTDLAQFWFARSGDNQAADLCSRGTTEMRLLDRESIWQRGPPWVYRPRAEWPLAQNIKTAQPVPDLRAESLARRTLRAILPPPDPDATRHVLTPIAYPLVKPIPCQVYRAIQTLGETPSFAKDVLSAHLEIAEFGPDQEEFIASLVDLRRHDNLDLWLAVTARVLHAVSWRSGTQSILSRLTAPHVPLREREIARRFWLRQAQRSLVPGIKSGKYASLTPFLDEDGIWRINGRSRATSNYLPILLPGNHPVSRLIVIAIHRRCHDGRGSTASRTRADYHILRVRRLAGQVRSSCQLCTLKEKRLLKVPMAPLPVARLEPTYAFEHASCDLFGPLSIRLEGRVTRNKSFDGEKLKAYGVLFACLSTRAVHLEVMQGQDTSAFLLAFRRFIALRGQPRTMYSDNGGQLVAADEDLRQMVASWDIDKLHLFGAQNGMTWSWTSPGSPWANGITEALIRSVKRSLEHVMPAKTLTILELQTVLTEVAELMNERPIGVGSRHFSGDDFDGESNYLCPNQLLLGRSTTRIPAGPFESVNVSHANRFLANQAIVTRWWQHWNAEYLPSLVSQSKWFRSDRHSKVGDIVQVRDINPVRGNWNIAEIIGIKPSSDDLPRNVLLRYKTAHPGKQYRASPFRTQWRDVKNLSLLVAVEDRSELNPLAREFTPGRDVTSA